LVGCEFGTSVGLEEANGGEELVGELGADVRSLGLHRMLGWTR
jgi:hypothetical protein